MRGVVISGDNEEWGYDSDSDLETALDFCAPVWTFSFRIVGFDLWSGNENGLAKISIYLSTY